MNVQTDYRAAAVTMLTEYAASVPLKLQVYRARPATIYPPTGFIDRMGETIDPVGVATYQRTPTAEVLVLHGLFDSGEAVDQRDAFVDGFVAWVKARVHAAGANSLVAVIAVEDDPTFVPDWVRTADGKPPPTYYATRITLEGYVGDN